MLINTEELVVISSDSKFAGTVPQNFSKGYSIYAFVYMNGVLYCVLKKNIPTIFL